MRLGHPIPACRIVAVILPPALDSAFMVSLIAATGVLKVARSVAVIFKTGALHCYRVRATRRPGDHPSLPRR